MGEAGGGLQVAGYKLKVENQDRLAGRGENPSPRRRAWEGRRRQEFLILGF